MSGGSASALPRMAVGELMASCACTSSPLLRAGRVVCASCGAPVLAGSSAPRAFSKTNLPDGLRDTPKFYRVARALRAAGDPECWKEGRAVMMTPDAWQRGLTLLGQGRDRSPRPPPSKAAPADLDSEVLAELGLTRKVR